MARGLLATILAILIASCPALCGTDGAGHALGRCEADSQPGQTSTDHQSEDAPTPCPDDGGSCICGGAISILDARIDFDADRGSPSSLAPVDLAPPSLLDLLVRHHLTSGGEPTGLAGLGDRSRIRALLQHIRC